MQRLKSDWCYHIVLILETLILDKNKLPSDGKKIKSNIDIFSHFVQDMGVKTDKYVMLYSLYSYPNVILCFFGGFLLDRVFGVR